MDLSLHAQPAPTRPSSATSKHERYFIRSITEDERPGHAPPPVCETDHASLASLDAKRRLGESGSSSSAPDGENISSTGRTVLIKDKTSWSYVLRSGLAGGIAGCVAKTAIAPLDRVKILFQAQNPEFAKYSGRAMGVFRAARDIVRSQGPTALFQGHSATLLRIFPYAAIKYMAYDKLHFHLMPTKRDETGARLFLAGSASGVLSVFMTYPLELIRVRLAFETKGKKGTGGLRRIVQQIYTEGATEAPFSSDARRRAARSGGGSGGAGAAAAKSVASTSTAHLSTSAIQAQAIAAGAGPHSPVPLSESPGAASRLLAQWPVLKFYRGFSVTVMGMIPYAGTSFLVFGRCKTALQTLFPPGEDEVAQGGRKKWWWPSKTTVDLTAGALAGAISQTAAYPFEVIRRRQQVGATVRPAACSACARRRSGSGARAASEASTSASASASSRSCP